MSSPLDAVRSLYFSLEDKYYAFLDSIQKKVPVYSVVDPVDKILPSFGIILALFVALIGFGLVGVLGGVLGGEKYSLSLTLNDSSGDGVEGVSVSLEQNGVEVVSGTTSANGKLVLRAAAGTYQLRASKEGFTSVFQEIELDKSKSQIFTLRDLVSAAKQRALLVQDSSGNVLGVLNSVTINLAFSCQSGDAPSPQTSFSGNITFLQPGGCEGLSVNVSAIGYISKTVPILNDSTIISLSSSADFGGVPETPVPVSGTIDVLVKGADGSPIDQAQVKLYKIPAAGSNILVNQSLSDPNGLSVLENVSPGRHVITVSKSGFKQATSAEFQVNAGETVSQSITLPIATTKRKIFVKVVSSLNQVPVSGARVTLFAQTSFGNYIEYDSYSTDTNGVVSAPLADFNGSTQLVVEHANFVTEISPNTGIVLEDQSAPIPILVDPLQAANANGTIPNALIVKVKVLDEVGLPVNNADVFLHTPDANGLTLSTTKSNAQGIATFSNLPAGTYQATAETTIAEGTSTKLQGAVGTILTLPITLTLGNALVKVTVKDELNSFVGDANVSIYSLNGNVLQSRGVTNAQGLVTLGAATNQQVYVKVEKATYLPYISVPFDVIKNNTHSIDIQVSLTSASLAADISLQRIDQISNTGAITLAQSLAAGGLYAFHFSVKSLVAQDDLKGLVFLNANSSAPHAATDVGSIFGGQSAKGGVAFYTTHNPTSPFSPSVPVDSNTPAKVALNSVGDVNGAASYELVVFVKINASAVPQTDKLDVHFQAKSASNISTEYLESYTIGQALNQGNFSFVLFYTPDGSTVPVQINSAVPLVLEKDVVYTIDYQVSNATSTNQPNASLSLLKDVPSLVTNVNTIALPLPGNSSSSGSFTLKSSVPCSSTAPYCATLTPTLNGISGQTPPAFPIKVFTTPAKALFLSASPSYLIPAQPQSVQVVVRDHLNAIAGTAQGVQVVGQIKDAAGVAVGNPITFTPSPFHIFSGAIPPSPNGSALEIVATASGYFSDTKIIPITNQIILNFSQDFGCVSIVSVPAQNPLSFAIGSSGSIRVTTSNCPAGLKLYTAGFTSPSGTVIKLDVKDPSAPSASALITSTNPLSLSTNASKTLAVSNPSSGFGMYPLYVYAKYDNQPAGTAFSLVKNVDVLIQPLTGTNNCLNLSKYVFDIQDGADAASVINRCNPLIHDAFYPRVTLPVSGVYGHALPSILTPELANPGFPVAFDYRVNVDYNTSFDANVDHVDFPILAIGDGNWHRYEVVNAPQILTNKSDYPSSFILRQDSVYSLHCSGCPNDAHSDFFLEDTQNAVQELRPPSTPTKISVLYETTFIAKERFSLDKLCFMTENVQDVRVIIDGVVVQSAPSYFDSGDNQERRECGTNPIFNFVFTPGPHVIQFFFYRNKTDPRYAVKVKYRDAPFTNNSPNNFDKLSNDFGRGYYLSPEYGSTFNTYTLPNGTYAVDSSHIITPSVSLSTPSSAGLLSSFAGGSDVLKILSNENGLDNLKQTYTHVSTNNPSVRAFLLGDAVRAQYVGFDDPSLTQNVLVENISLNGEQYGIVTLEDYSTGSPSASTVMDVGILIDASPSVILNEPDERAGAASPRQEGICRYVKNIKDSIEYYSGATVNLQIALMGDVNSFYHASPTPAQNIPCLSQWPNTIVLNSDTFTGHVPGATYVNGEHDVKEAWAWAAEKFSALPFWQHPAKVMIVITDNKPSGLGPNVSVSEWNPTLEQTLVDHASSALQSVGNTGIRGVVLYRTPLESNAASPTPLNGDPGVFSRAIDMYSRFAQSTNGFVEALDNAELLNTNANPQSFEHAHYSKVGIRLAQTAFTRAPETMVVKLIAQPANVCAGENGESGTTGASVFSQLSYDWRWNALSVDTCDAKPNNASNFKYCDSTQFLVTLIQKLNALKDAYSTTATPAQVALIPTLTNFDTYLMYDGLSDDFRSDFVEFFDTSAFSDAPPYFRSTLEGQWKDYVLSPSNLSFEIDGVENATTIPSPGLYRARIEITWNGDSGEFFVASSPQAHVNVVLTKLADASSLSGYTELVELPLDGLIGVDDSDTPIMFHRDGYGTAFSGSVVDLVPTPGLTLRSYPNKAGNTALNTYNVPTQANAQTLNTQSRGELFRLDRGAGVLNIRPSLPVPVALEWSSNAFGKGDVYYAVKETSSPTFMSGQTLLKWTPFASVRKQTTLSCAGNNCNICLDGGSNAYVSSVALDRNPVAGTSCAITPLPNSSASNFFGFTSTSVLDNTAHLGSIFYREPGVDYTLYMGCNPNQSKPTGRILTPNGIVDGSPSTIPLTNDSTLEDTLDDALSFAGMINLASNAYTCTSTANGQTTIYWNSKKLRDDLATSTGWGAGNTCTATGSPFGNAGTFTLNERADPIFAAGQSPSLGFCPLFNANDPVQGYYGQSGIPYPVGTKVFFPSGSPNTGDAADSKVQYRYAPTQCTNNASGFNCPGTNTFDVCSQNVERYWSGTPIILP